MQYLKADTNVEILLGPAVAVGDGFTPVTNLSLSSADEAEIIKNNGATALVVTSISGNTIAAITGADGYYTLDITTGNVDTEGPLTILVNDDSLILPIRQDYMVVNANVYDSMFAVAGTDLLDVSLLQIGGDAQSATDLKDFADDGYNPATNKVTGVLLVDTTTVSTDAEADIAALNDAPAVSAAAIVNEWESQSQADPTGFHVNVLEVSGTAEDLPTATALADVPTVAEFNARTLVAASYFDPAADAVANVTLVATTTTNTDQRGTDSAALASVCTEVRLSELDEATAGKMANQVDIIQVDTTTDIPALIAALNDISVSDILTTQMTEAFAADGVAPTLAQALFLIQQILGDFGIAGTTLTVRKIDGVTTAATFTLDDDTNPTDLTRAT